MIKQAASVPNISRLGQVVIAALLTLAVLFFVSSSIQGQDDPVKQKVVEQMRQIANSMKQCSARKVTAYQHDCTVTYSYSGPPANLEWDVVPSKTVRSPFQGVIEFILPERSETVQQPNLSDKERQKCEQNEHDKKAFEAKVAKDEASVPGMKADIDSEVQRLEKQGQKNRELAEKKKLHDTHYRYEFDLGYGPPDLVKMLLVGKDSDNNIVSKPVRLETAGIPHPLTWAGTDPAISDPTACWVAAAKSSVVK